MNFFYIFLDLIKLNIENNFIITFFLFFTFLVIYSSFSIPGNLVFIASTGYFFGIYFGYILSILSLVLGSLVFFIFSKFFFKRLFPNTYLKYSYNVTNYIAKSSAEYLIIFRLIPGTPLILQNLCLSLLDIKKATFILTSLIGFTPIVFITVFIGYQLNNLDNLKKLSLADLFSKEFIIFIIFIVVFLILKIIYKKHKN